MKLHEVDDIKLHPVGATPNPLVHKSDRRDRKAQLRAVYTAWLSGSDEYDDMPV